MTTPEQVPPFDLGNHLLAETPSQLTTQVRDTPAGQRLILTVRTTSATVSVMLDGPDAKAWAAQVTRDSAAMSGSGLIVANGAVKP